MTGADVAGGLAARASVVLWIAAVLVVALMLGAFALGHSCAPAPVVADSAPAERAQAEQEKKIEAVTRKSVTKRRAADTAAAHEVTRATTESDLASYLAARTGRVDQAAPVYAGDGQPNADAITPVARSPPDADRPQ